MLRILTAALLWIGLTTASADQFGLGDEFWVAYYEVAPRSAAAAMRKAVEEECAQVTTLEGFEWFCGPGPVFFVRGIDQWGRKQKTGFVCEGESSGRKYFPTSMFRKPYCLPIEHDSKIGLYVGR